MLVSNLTFYTSHVVDSELENCLKEKIKDFNNRVSPHHAAIRQEGAVKPVYITVNNPNNDLIAGIHSEMYWGWLDIKFLWVAEEFRSQGIGTLLLSKAENEAKKHGCSKVKLTTFSFQAKEFYTKYGYSVVGQLTDYPPGSTYYTMVKNL